MASELQIFGYIVTWTAFPLGIASCFARAFCCKWVTRCWKVDDYMSIIVGVSGFSMFKKTRLMLDVVDNPNPSASFLAEKSYAMLRVKLSLRDHGHPF
jgi:hypothetical protein